MPSVQTFDLLLFGGTGDLATRKLLPALYYRHCDGDFPPHGRIIGLARQEMSRDEYLNKVREGCTKFVSSKHFDEGKFNSFANRLDYLSFDAKSQESYQRLASYLRDSPAEVRIFYLSTAPDLFTIICKNLATENLIHENSRVVLEKPLGHDLASSQAINETVGSVFTETQIYRIDHYLGKEPVQNLMALRFGNALFEPLWSRHWVNDVQITIAEQVGVEKRGEFYNQTGALRDMVQNHLLQLVCMIAMEPPSSIDPFAVRDEKLKVLRALNPMTPQDVAQNAIRAQYRAGAINGQPVCGFLDEADIPKNSNTETFVALKAEINNWRWSGVPFYLRTGKRLAERRAEIVVNFRKVSHSIFPMSSGSSNINRLVIQLQPDEELKLYLMTKSPGDGMSLKPVHLNLDFCDLLQSRPMDGYERLLMDIIRGKLTLFMRWDELDAAWRWVEPIMEVWGANNEKIKSYTAGSWGPSSSSTLLAKHGANWFEED